MFKLTEKQLKNCQLADLSNFDEKTNTYYIKKYSKPDFEIGKCYLIGIPSELVNNTNSVLAVNWNNSTAPSGNYLRVFVEKTLGKMIYVRGVIVDHNTNQVSHSFWDGWLDITEITMISEI